MQLEKLKRLRSSERQVIQMQEVFEKILERLEGDSFLTTNDDGETSDLSIQVVSLKDAKKIVQEVAE